MKLIPLCVSFSLLISASACSSDDSSSGTGGTSSGGTSSGGTSSGGTSSGGTGGTSTGGSSGSATGGSAGLAGTFGESACMQCVLGACSADYAACLSDSACKQNLACVLACPPKNSHEVDETCADACGNVENNAALDAFGACYKDAVDNACSVPCD